MNAIAGSRSERGAATIDDSGTEANSRTVRGVQVARFARSGEGRGVDCGMRQFLRYRSGTGQASRVG